MAWRIGIDSGGTFTDVCLFDGKSGRIAVWKVSSTTADPSLAIAEGLGEALAQIGVNASDVSYFGHGTTVATNALIQHRGARTGLITSDGFATFSKSVDKKDPNFTRRTNRLCSWSEGCVSKCRNGCAMTGASKPR
jgi:N-methylhydantoinase A